MQTYLTTISNYLIAQSWQIAILIAVIATVSWLLRKKSAHVRYLLWLIVLAKCLVPPLVTIPLAILPEEEHATTVFRSMNTIPIESVEPVELSPTIIPQRTSNNTTPTNTATEQPVRLTVNQWLGIVWITGIFLFVIIVLIKTWRTNRWLRKKRKPLEIGQQNGILDLFTDLKFKTFPKVWLVEGIGQPFVWGLLRGGVYLPLDFVNVKSKEQRRDILGHELGHILRYDAAVNLLQIFAQGIFWFHPFVWWANKRIRAEREKCCDEITIAGLGAKAKEYSKAIVNVLISEYKHTQPVPSLAVAGPVKNIEERIKTMLRPGKKFYKRPSLVAAIIVMLLALLTVPIGCVLTKRAETKTTIDFMEVSNNPFHQAVAKGDIEQVKKLLADGADVNTRDERSQTPLHYAARGGHEEIVRLLIDKGADVNISMEGESWTPLLDAATKGHAQIAKLLLENGAKVDIGDDYGYTPLYYAIWNEDEESIRMFIKAGADINKRVNAGDVSNPFFEAVWMEDPNLVKILIDAGADVNYKDQSGTTPLRCAVEAVDVETARLFIGTDINIPEFHKAAFEGNIDKVREFVESGTDVDIKDELGWTPSYWALSAGQNEIFEYLFNNGADITIQTKDGHTLLHYACKAGLTEIVEQLIAKGADVSVKNMAGETPLLYAASKGREKIVKLLVNKGANINATSLNGHAALGDAAEAGHEEIVKFLIDSGANVNLNARIHLIGEYRGTALQAAIYYGHSSIVNLLIANGADVNINALNGRPLHFAVRSPQTVDDETCAEIVKKLLAKGADVNGKDLEGRTSLHSAAQRGRLKAVELLIAAGADVNAKDKLGFTPLWHAKDKYPMDEDDNKIIELLHKHGASESLYDAIGAGDINLVKKMIANGADVNTKTDGWLIAPIHLALREDICELLIASGAEINVKSGQMDIFGNMKDGGWTPLHVACFEGNQEVAELLIANGAAVNDKTRNKLTPLDLAGRNNQPEVIELLQKHGGKEGTSPQERFKNARLISSGRWFEGSFQYRTDEEWFVIDVEENKSYLVYFDDAFGTGKYTADIETYLYKQIYDNLESNHYLYTDRHGVYQEPIRFTSDYNGQLYLRLVSDNPENNTFAIKYETAEE